MIDHIITRKRDHSECLITRVMRGAQCNTDHSMQRAILVTSIRPPMRKTGLSAEKLNTAHLKCVQKASEFQTAITGALSPSSDGQVSQCVTEEWASLYKKLHDKYRDTGLQKEASSRLA